MKDGTKLCDFWDRRSCYWVIRDKLWDKQGDFLGHKKLILSQNKTNYGTKGGNFLGQEKLIQGHNQMKYGTEQGDFLGQEKLTYGHNKTNFGPDQGDIWDRRS